MKRLLILLLLAVPLRAQLSPQANSTGTITAAGATCNTTNACVTIHIENYNPSTPNKIFVPTVLVNLTGTWAATMVFEHSTDNQQTWTFVRAVSFNGTWRFTLHNMTDFRVRASAYSSGSALALLTAASDVNSLNGFYPLSSSGSPQGVYNCNPQDPDLGKVQYWDYTAGQIYYCTAVNTWTAGGGGGGAVSSVFARTGAVVAAANDYTLSQIGLSPLTTSQDILYDNAGTLARLPIVTSGNCLGNTAGAWASIVCGGGSGTISSGTTNTLPKYTASTTVGNSLLSDSGTLLSYTGTGGISSTSDGVHPGNLSLVGNTTVVAPATNTFNIMGPSSATFTAYALQYSATGPAAAGISHVGAPSSGVSQLTFSPIVAADITNNTVTDTQLSTTGATAASCGDTTHSCSLTITTAGRITANSNNVIAGGGGGGGAAGSFAQAFTAQTSVTITGATHTLGTANILVGVYDGATPANVILPANVTVDPSTFNVVVTFNSSQTGTIVLVAGASKYIAAFGSTTSLSVTAATHKLGASIFHVTVYDASSGTRNRIEPGNLAIDASGNVTVAFAVAQAGQIVIE